MDKNKIKKYAINARTELINAIKRTPGQYKRPYILVLIFLSHIKNLWVRF